MHYLAAAAGDTLGGLIIGVVLSILIICWLAGGRPKGK